jgi:hypothetical protein
MLNARAAGSVSPRQGRTAETFSITGLSAGKSAPVLQRYAQAMPIIRPYFDAKPDAPVGDCGAEAVQHPVFGLNLIDNRK